MEVVEFISDNLILSVCCLEHTAYVSITCQLAYVMRVWVDVPSCVALAPLQWMQHTQQNKGTEPAGTSSCNMIVQYIVYSQTHNSVRQVIMNTLIKSVT